VTAALFVAYGVAVAMSHSPTVDLATPYVAVVGGVLVGLFAIFPWNRALYLLSGTVGFMLWVGQSIRFFVRVILDGFDQTDWLRLAYAFAFGYFAFVFAVMWVTSVKPWHNVQWARYRVTRERRDG
jgi:hypothetical protein